MMINKNNTFGDNITELRVRQGLNLRAVSKRLKMLTLTKYSKIERSIQNPRNKDEFDDIIQAIGLTDSQLISELEILANKFIQPPTIDKKEILKRLPVFISAKYKTKEDLDKFLDNYEKIIIESDTPE